jgi:hypothetical protein
MKPRDRTLPDLVLTMEGADRRRWGIKSWRETGASSISVVESGGELCGLLIIGIGEADRRPGGGVEGNNACRCAVGSLGGLVIGNALALLGDISALSIRFVVFLVCELLSRVWPEVDVCEYEYGSVVL